MKIVREYLYEVNSIKGGKGDNLSPKDVNRDQLLLGIEVEMEHTNNKKQAKEIALDHLKENPKYYTILIKAGLVDETSALKKYNEIK